MKFSLVSSLETFDLPLLILNFYDPRITKQHQKRLERRGD